MRALRVPEAGGEPAVGEVPRPRVAPGHVLVSVRAAGLNPLDNVLAAGLLADRFPYTYPLVLGRDAAGTVLAVGAGVDHVRPGQEVFGHTPLAAPLGAGTLAEYALLPAETVVPRPLGLDFVAAAALPLASAAAFAAVDRIDPGPGETVLVDGATGGVGRYAVQLLALRGARVVATGGAEDCARLTALGARLVVDRAAGPVARQVRGLFPGGVDALIHLTSEDAPLDAVRAGGRVATTTGVPGPEALAAAGLTGSTVYARPLRETVEPLAEQAADGTLAVDVYAVLPLERATEGLAVLAAGKARGKIVVTLGD
ncbi:NADP-dependent oxidoreductase [Streptomyces sp. NPDC004539]|uniref:NADP-dependent oxidoreductase n=1 Tax=Streptomyces sp. NPDC004539 TaxID=3154280 RepID=UPI0033A60815